jgi:hypothetical protein
MRISVGILASAAVLFLAGALGVIASWGLVAGTMLALVGGVGLVIHLEEQDQANAGLAAFLEHGV